MTRRTLRQPLAVALITGLSLKAAFAQAPPLPPPPPSAPTTTTPAPAKPPVKGPPGVAAVVNGQPITDAQVKDEAFATTGARVLNQMILFTLIDQEAKKQGIVVTHDEIASRLDQVRTQAAARGGLDALLKQNGETLAQVEKGLAEQLKAEKLASKNIGPAVHVEHILVLTQNPRQDPTVKPHTDADAKAIVDKAQAELKAGKDFADVAKEYSEDPGSKNTGGDDGWISSATPYIPEFLTAALGLKTGETTVINTPEYGYFIIKSISDGTGVTGAAKQAYDAARQAEVNQAVNDYLQKLPTTAKIENYLAPGP